MKIKVTIYERILATLVLPNNPDGSHLENVGGELYQVSVK